MLTKEEHVSAIHEADFEDETSRFIFRMLKKRYEENDGSYILRMVCRLHNSVVERINRHYEDAQPIVEQTAKAVQAGLKIVIFGPGERGKQTYDFLTKHGFSENIHSFLSNTEKRWGTELYGKKILPVEKIIEQGKQFAVIIPGGRYAEEMEQQLVDAKFPEKHLLRLKGKYAAVSVMPYRDDLEEIFFDKQNGFVICGTDLPEHLFGNMLYHAGMPDFLTVDGSTEEIAVDIARFGSGPESDRYFYICMNGVNEDKLLSIGIPQRQILRFITSMDWAQYFDDEVVPPHVEGKREVFIDAGSYNLGTSLEFLDWCQHECDRIFAFECDTRGLKLCRKRKEQNGKLNKIVQLIPKGCWSEKTTLHLQEDQIAATASHIVSAPSSGVDTVVEIETESIDNVLAGSEATFIKMDIEGSELEALKGAEQTILKWHPTLAISLYHKPEDIIEIPSYIKSLVPEYKLYIRTYHEEYTEIVLYAIYPQ